MAEKTILILVDGMRPDGLLNCGNPFAAELIQASSNALDAKTVMPSVTLPCHMSLFHSVDPERHGVVTNTYVPQVRPISGLIDQLDLYGKKCAMFYTWEELRDLARCDHLHEAVCMNLHKREHADSDIAEAAIHYIQKEKPDFLFLYLGETDEIGHKYGWMGQEYLAAIHHALSITEKIFRQFSAEYNVILTADHGGHGRSHGTEADEDMTIPILFAGESFEKGKALENVSIKDIAVTVAALLQVPPAKEWEGKDVRK